MTFDPDVTENEVSLRSFSYETRRALKLYSERHGLEECIGDRILVESHWLAWLTELLKQEEDCPVSFPKGKWATIQAIERLIEASAQLAVKAAAHD